MPVSILKIIPQSEVINSEIEDGSGQVLGKISNVLLDVAEGRLAYAILSSKGFPGMDKSHYPIPWAALIPATRRHTYKLNADADFLKNAPRFDNDHLPDFSSIEWNESINRYYQVQPYWQTTGNGQAPLSGQNFTPEQSGYSEQDNRAAFEVQQNGPVPHH